MRQLLLAYFILLISISKSRAQITQVYRVVVTTKDINYQVNKNASFGVSFTSNVSQKLIKKITYAYNIQPTDTLPYNPNLVFSIRNLDSIIFRIIREDTSKSTEVAPVTNGSTVNSNSKLDTSFVRFFQAPEELDSSKNSSFFISSFVKSIAGTSVPNNELLDLFLKVTFGQQKRCFGFIGADAGISALSQQNSNNTFKINEAMTNLNYAVYRRKKYKVPTLGKPDKENADLYTQKVTARITARAKNEKYWSDTLMRTGFFGAGLKIFNTQPYIGCHFGVTEINGPLFGSYMLAGFYISPYNINPVTDTTLNPFRNNIYLEAGFNAFGKNVPGMLKTIRLKFGLMLPIGNKTDVPFVSKNVYSRLAVEVPLGSVFKFGNLF